MKGDQSQRGCAKKEPAETNDDPSEAAHTADDEAAAEPHTHDRRFGLEISKAFSGLHSALNSQKALE